MREKEIKLIYDKYHDMVFRTAFLYFRNEADACDVVQEVFIRLIKEEKNFEDEQHVKAWLMRVAANQSKSVLRSFWRKKRMDEQLLNHLIIEEEPDSILYYVLMKLPKEARLLLYMHYYEGYKLDEIAQIMERNASTIRSKIARARLQLRKELEKEDCICLQSMSEEYWKKYE